MRGVAAVLLLFCVLLPQAHGASEPYTHFVCVPELPSSADLTQSNSAFDIETLSASLYDNLVRLDDKGLPQAALAERWEVSADGLWYRFKIRENVPFHSSPDFKPTRDMSAADVAFSLNRLLSPEAFFAQAGGRISLATEFPREKIISVVAVDDWVEIHLHARDVELVEKLSGHDTHILSLEYAEFLDGVDRREQFSLAPIGTGPFHYVRHSDEKYVLSRFHAHWAGAVNFSGLVFVAAADELDRLGKLRMGECAQAIDLGPRILERAKQMQGFEIQRGPILSVLFLALDTRQPPWHDVRARRALSLAVNRRRILKLLFHSTSAEYARYSIHPDLLGLGPARRPEHNPQSARDLIKQVVPRGGVSLTISSVDAARPHNPNPRRMAELVAQDLRAIGVDVSMEWIPLEKISERAIDLDPAAYQSLLMGYSVSAPLVSSFSSNLLGCEGGMAKQLNFSRFCDHQLDALLHDASAESRPEERRMLNLAAAERSFQLVQYVNILHAEHVDIIRDDIKSVRRRATGLLDFRLGRVER